MRTLRAVKIDVENRLISEVTIGDGIEDIRKHVDCDLFTVAANFNPDDDEVMWDSLFVDDEGLLIPGKKLFSVNFPGWDFQREFAGNGLILGVNMNTGESADARISLFDVAQYIEWTDKITTGG
jgi:hypothetical protein